MPLFVVRQVVLVIVSWMELHASVRMAAVMMNQADLALAKRLSSMASPSVTTRGIHKDVQTTCVIMASAQLSVMKTRVEMVASVILQSLISVLSVKETLTVLQVHATFMECATM